MILLYNRVFLGTLKSPLYYDSKISSNLKQPKLKDLSKSQFFILTLSTILCIYIGVYPQSVFTVIYDFVIYIKSGGL